jgi:hypothetical protein
MSAAARSLAPEDAAQAVAQIVEHAAELRAGNGNEGANVAGMEPVKK